MDNFAHSDARTFSPQEGVSTSSDGVANALYRDAYASQPKSDAKRQNVSSNKADWTLAIDLTASLGAEGTANQFHHLQSIAQESKGVPVDLVVQVAEPLVPPGGKELDPRTPRKVDRYMIHDGALTKLGHATTSKGFAADLTDLLQTANEKAPSNHLGLILQSHGAGAYGVGGDTGESDLPKFTQAISNGLKGGSHDKLDVVDFDSCMMGHLKVAETMAPMALHMVASSLAENAGPRGLYDGQNLQATVRSLFHTPTMSASELAKDFITQADRGANDAYVEEHKQRESGTPTLAHFDLVNLPTYNERLNELGRALDDAEKDPLKGKVIGNAIEESQKPSFTISDGGPGLASEFADMTSFTTNLQHSLDIGELKDPAVQSAVKNLIDAQNQLIPQSHVDVDSQLSNPAAEMSAFLPDDAMLGTRGADHFDGLGEMLEMLGPPSNDGEVADEDLEATNKLAAKLAAPKNELQPKDPNAARILRWDVDRMAMYLGSTHSAEIAELRKDVGQLVSAKQGPAFDDALTQLRITANELNDSDFGRDLRNKASVDYRDNAYKVQNLQLPDWQSFIENLRHGQS
ncbi:MAG TPA: clostripain-related cysteine peptidase [Oculatellaceae cyanobacterium]